MRWPQTQQLSLRSILIVKVLANEDTLLPTQMFPRLSARATFVAGSNFVSATNVPQFAQPKKHHEQQCVRNNVSSFARAFIGITKKTPHSMRII